MNYVVFSPHALVEMSSTVAYNLGNIFSVALWCYLVVLGVLVAVDIISNIGR